MSTNACIAVSNSYHDFDLEAIYCHWDGGQTLADELDGHFTTWEQVRELISNGDVSSISEGYAESYHSRGDVWGRVKPVSGDLVMLLKKYPTAEFFHIFHDGEWENLTREETKEIISEFEELA